MEMTLLEEVRLRLHTKMTLSLEDAELAATIAMEAVAKRMLEHRIEFIHVPFRWMQNQEGVRHQDNRRFLGLAWGIAKEQARGN